jgi:hypothetical protein
MTQVHVVFQEACKSEAIEKPRRYYRNERFSGQPGVRIWIISFGNGRSGNRATLLKISIDQRIP